jgi:hypothetical protein
MVWQTFDEEKVTLSEDGAVATKLGNNNNSTLVTSGVELTAGKHYWEVELLNDDNGAVYIGVTRPNLDPDGDYAGRESTDVWFICTYGGFAHLDIDKGDRVGVLLDLDEGSLRFFKNGVQHGAGYPAGSVTGPVVCAMQLFAFNTSARLLPQDADHALLQ